MGRAATIRAPVQIPDILDEREYAATRARPLLTRLRLPFLLPCRCFAKQQIMGGLTVWRQATGQFSPEVVNLLANLRNPIRPGDPKRAAVPGDRG